MMGDDLESPSGQTAEDAEDASSSERAPTPERALMGAAAPQQKKTAPPHQTARATTDPAKSPAASAQGARAAAANTAADTNDASSDAQRANAAAPVDPLFEHASNPQTVPAAAPTMHAGQGAFYGLDASDSENAEAHKNSGARRGRFFDVDTAALEAQGFIVPETGPQLLAEEYRHIKRRILGNMVPGMLKTKRPLNLVMITSAVPGEGKTFTSVNLALSIAAELDRTVLLVDSDIVKGDLTRAFGLNNQLGLFDYLEEPTMGVENVIYRTSIDSLSVIPAGRSRKAISEKLASGMMKDLTDELAERYGDRVIIFDCPPVLATTGAVALAPHVSQIVMVVEARDTAQSTVRDALRVIGEDRVTGALLNKSKNASSGGDYYYRTSGYGNSSYGTPAQQPQGV